MSKEKSNYKIRIVNQLDNYYFAILGFNFTFSRR